MDEKDRQTWDKIGTDTQRYKRGREQVRAKQKAERDHQSKIEEYDGNGQERENMERKKE